MNIKIKIKKINGEHIISFYLFYLIVLLKKSSKATTTFYTYFEKNKNKR